MKKVWILSALIMIVFTFYQINYTYAKYLTEASGQAQKSIGAWIVKVNGTNISTGTEKQKFEINQLQYNSNNYVLEGKIAPGLMGYFDVEIDATEASVAVVYDISIDFSSLNVSDAIKFSKLVKVIDGVEEQTGIVKTGASTYTGTIDLSEIEQGKTATVRVYIEWEDDKTGVNDEADSILGKQMNLKVPIPVEVTVSQYMGEEIVEYTEP